jgi:hypothetical protein
MHGTLSLRPRVELISKLLSFKSTRAFLVFLMFQGRQQSAQHRCQAPIEMRWGDRVIPYHARCPE